MTWRSFKRQSDTARKIQSDDMEKKAFMYHSV